MWGEHVPGIFPFWGAQGSLLFSKIEFFFIKPNINRLGWGVFFIEYTQRMSFFLLKFEFFFFVGKDIPQKVIVGAFPQAFSVEHKRAFHAGCSAHGSASQVLFTLLSIEQGVLWFSGIKRQGKIPSGPL